MSKRQPKPAPDLCVCCEERPIWKGPYRGEPDRLCRDCWGHARGPWVIDRETLTVWSAAPQQQRIADVEGGERDLGLVGRAWDLLRLARVLTRQPTPDQLASGLEELKKVVDEIDRDFDP